MSLELVNISKGFGEGAARTEVLENIELKIDKGEFVAIVGFTGSGKSTLLKLMSGLLKPDKGNVLLNGQPLRGPVKEQGVVFQNYSLLPWLTVLQNVLLAVDEVYPHWTKRQRHDHAKKYVEMVNLGPAINKHPAALSGGMRQRVAVARALSMNPQMLLMDEPLSALDAITRGTLQQEIVNIWGQDKTTALLITNDVDEGILMADRIIPLNPGPKATLGPEFKIALDRPRDKTALNDSEDFIKVRNQIMEYLMDMSEESGTHRTNAYHLPEIDPVMPRSVLRRPIKKAA